MEKVLEKLNQWLDEEKELLLELGHETLMNIDNNMFAEFSESYQRQRIITETIQDAIELVKDTK